MRRDGVERTNLVNLFVTRRAFRDLTISSFSPTSSKDALIQQMSSPSVVMHKGKLQRSWPQLPPDIIGCALPRRWLTG